MKPWHVDVAFVVAMALLVFFAVAPYFGLEASPPPLVVAAFGTVIGFFFARNRPNGGDSDG